MLRSAPRPPHRNPFVKDSRMALLFDGILTLYAEGHRDLVRENETVRCMGNNMAVNFWRGYDSAPPARATTNTLAWACYRAGQRQRLLDNKRGVYLPPKTNSCVPLKK